jgi:hypothetical protein
MTIGSRVLSVLLVVLAVIGLLALFFLFSMLFMHGSMMGMTGHANMAAACQSMMAIPLSR